MVHYRNTIYKSRITPITRSAFNQIYPPSLPQTGSDSEKVIYFMPYCSTTALPQHDNYRSLQLVGGHFQMSFRKTRLWTTFTFRTCAYLLLADWEIAYVKCIYRRKQPREDLSPTAKDREEAIDCDSRCG